MKFNYITLVIFIALLSCSKDDGGIATPAKSDDSGPVITITSPTPGQVINNGEDVNIVIDLTDKDELHEYSIQVKDLDSKINLFSAEEHQHGTSTRIEHSFEAETTAAIDIRLTVTASDHNGNVSDKEVLFEIVP